jgi:hypothetical protein
MGNKTTSTRRTFIQTAGAALSVPLAAAAHAGASAAPAEEPLEVRLARLEDERSIRLLNQEFARRVNAGNRNALAELCPDPSGMAIDAELRTMTPDVVDGQGAIEIAPDRRTAVATERCLAHFEHEIGPSCTLVEMARAQGGGVVRHTERGIVEHTYVRHEGVWTIAQSSFRVADQTP